MLPVNPLMDFVFRFIINFIVLLIVSRFIYYSGSRRKEYVFTFIIIGSTVFVLSFMLASINMELGLALGLFAIFGILRYRTRPIVVKEMTYLFFSITISVVNSLASAGYDNIHILVANGAIIIIILFMELVWMRRTVSTITIRYEKIQLIHPDRHSELLADLTDRLGIEIISFKVGDIDLLRDTAAVTIRYDARRYAYLTADHEQE